MNELIQFQVNLILSKFVNELILENFLASFIKYPELYHSTIRNIVMECDLCFTQVLTDEVNPGIHKVGTTVQLGADSGRHGDNKQRQHSVKPEYFTHRISNVRPLSEFSIQYTMMQIRNAILTLGLALCLLSTFWGQTIPGPVFTLNTVHPGVHYFKNCTIHTGKGTISQGVMVVRDGWIDAVGSSLPVPPGAVIHDLGGAWIYPGFIDLNTSYGVNVPQVPEGDDPQYSSARKGPYSWNDAIRPETDPSIGFITDPETAEKFRSMGFTHLHAFNHDGILRGSGMLVTTGSGSAGEELSGRNLSQNWSFDKGSSGQSYPSSLMGSIALIRQTLLDAQWYAACRKKLAQNPSSGTLPADISLEILSKQLADGLPAFFQANGYLHILRADKIAKEFGMKFTYISAGDEYKRIDAIKATGASFIVPLKFPKPFSFTALSDADHVTLAQLKAWEQAPYNALILQQSKIPFAFTTNGLKNEDEFFSAITALRKTGLQPQAILEALTLTPAKMLGIDQWAGSLEKGKTASFIISDGELFRPSGTILQTWVEGKPYPLHDLNSPDLRGTYSVSLDKTIWTMEIKGSRFEPEVLIWNTTDTTKLEGTLEQHVNTFTLSFSVEINDQKQFIQAGGTWKDGAIQGYADTGNGTKIWFTGNRTQLFSPSSANGDSIKIVPLSKISPVTYPNKSFGLSDIPRFGNYLITHTTVWSNTESGVMEDTDVLIQDGKIRQVGKGIKPPSGCTVIDGTGKHLSPGVIDEHSHIGISEGVNEGSHSISAEVRIGDVIQPEDINIYRQLSGGVVAAQLLHGSANCIGGQSAIIKLRWGRLPEEYKIQDAPGFIKFALGENVKQSNWGENYTIRYPQTRLGVEQFMKDRFQAALDYQRQWDAYVKAGGEKSGLLPPRRNLQLEPVLEIIKGKRFISCHSYVQSEINMLMKLAESFGFRVNTFTHVLEGYKVADKMKEHGVTGSTFADWWAYKMEVYDAIPYNAAILQYVGVNTCINSDDAEMGRRLNQEAAKSILYGNVNMEEALKMVTLNPAIALHLDHRMGVVKAGYDADLVLWSAPPLSVYARCEKTFVDGMLLYDIHQQTALVEQQRKEKLRIVARMMGDPDARKDGAPPVMDGGEIKYDCETVQSEYGYGK